MIKIRLYKNILIIISIITLFVLMSSGCSGTDSSKDPIDDTKTATPISVDFQDDDLETDWTEAESSKITLNKDSITFDGNGATVSGTKITINAGGTYVLSGNIDDGQIIINAKDEENVRLILNNANITNLTGSAIYVTDAKKIVLTLAEGTKNTISDGKSYENIDPESNEPDAAIFSKSNLTINGTGSLTVNGNYKHGITSKDELKIVSGDINVNATSDGIRGRDYIAIKDGTISINSKSDGMQSNNDEDKTKGFIYLEKGNIDITSGSDGIQAETQVLVKDGTINVTSGGGSENTLTEKQTADLDTESAKGIKAGVDITIDGGNITIHSSDDSFHSNDSLSIDGGIIKISSGDDGIHSDTSIVLNGGDTTIDKSYEGIESASIIVNDGNIYINASDDGFNGAGGNDESSVNGRPGQNEFNESNGIGITINNGYIFIDSEGDGIDVNGSITMNDGTVIVNGPTNSGNGALDYDGSFELKGGFLLAVGSAGMAQAPSDTSSQNILNINVGSQTAKTLIHIESESGENILTFSPSKEYESVVFSSPNLKENSTYNIYTTGSSTGSVNDGLYTDGTYSKGTELTSLKITDRITEYGSVSKQGGGMRNNGSMPANGERPDNGERPNKGINPTDEEGGAVPQPR